MQDGDREQSTTVGSDGSSYSPPRSLARWSHDLQVAGLLQVAHTGARRSQRAAKSVGFVKMAIQDWLDISLSLGYY